MDEVLQLLRKNFKELARIHVCGSNRIELEVSTALSHSDWLQRMKDFKDTGAKIPNSWELNGIRVVLFYGTVKAPPKININF
jgi:hypothetical protein